LSLFHRHKLGKITEDGRYQYCDTCGKAVPVKCKHHWEDTHRVSIYDEDDLFQDDGDEIGYEYHQKCKYCGDRRTIDG